MGEVLFPSAGTRKERQAIRVCEHAVRSHGSALLSKSLIAVMDGGACFFNVKYDPAKKSFYDLTINGEA